jgi:hypothetical protein
MIHKITGQFYKRPIEQLVSRLVETWPKSQPLHLRHLGIVRDTAQIGKTPFYVHYTFDDFKSLVESGKKSWEAVEVIKDSKGGMAKAKPDVDQYGFPKLNPSEFLSRDNNANLAECVCGADIEKLVFTGTPGWLPSLLLLGYH